MDHFPPPGNGLNYGIICSFCYSRESMNHDPVYLALPKKDKSASVLLRIGKDLHLLMLHGLSLLGLPCWQTGVSSFHSTWPSQGFYTLEDVHIHSRETRKLLGSPKSTALSESLFCFVHVCMHPYIACSFGMQGSGSYAYLFKGTVKNRTIKENLLWSLTMPSQWTTWLRCTLYFDNLSAERF